MRKTLFAGLGLAAIALLGFASAPLVGQTNFVVMWLCKSGTTNGYCPASTTYPLPVQQVAGGTPFIVQLEDPTTNSNVQNVLCQSSVSLGGTVCTALVQIVGPDGSVLTPSSNSVVVGPNASGVAQSGAPLPGGGTGFSAWPTAVTNTGAIAADFDLIGREIIVPYAPYQLMLRGTVTATTTGAATIIAAQGAAIKIYVTGVQCFRTDAGTAAITVTLNDTETTGSGTIIGLANSGGGGGNNPPLATPLVVAANTALTMTMSTNTTSVVCNAQGFAGP